MPIYTARREGESKGDIVAILAQVLDKSLSIQWDSRGDSGDIPTTWQHHGFWLLAWRLAIQQPGLLALAALL